MARYTPTGTVRSIPALNAELEKISEAFDGTLSREGDVPNQMEADLDMNGNEILNVVTDPNNPDSLVSRKDVYLQSEVDTKDATVLSQAQEYADAAANGVATSVVRYVQEDLPTPPILTGARWYKPSDGITYVYYVDGDSSQWVQETVNSFEGTLRDELADVDSDVLVGGVEAKTAVSRQINHINLGDKSLAGGFIEGDTPEAIAQNNAVIAAALSQAASTGAPLFIPTGNFFISVPVAIPTNCSGIYGEGYSSTLTVKDSDGIAFGASDIVGARFCKDFSLFSNNVFGGHTGIVVDAGTNPAARCTGLQFEGIYCAFFDTFMNCKGLWHSKIKNCVSNNCYDGIHLRGRNVSINIDACKLQTGFVTREADRTGILITRSTDYDGAAEFRPEAIKISNETLVYGFDYLIDVVTCLNFSCTESDLDYGGKVGVRVGTVDGGCVIDNNWFAGDVDGFIGVEFINIAVDTLQSSTVKSNSFTMNPTKTGNRAIFTGSLHGGISIESNSISGDYTTGIYLELNSQYNKVIGNMVLASTALNVQSSSNFISGNHFVNSILIGSSSLRNDWGSNTGATITRKTTTVTVPAGSTSQTFSVASLGFGSLVNNQKITVNAWQSDQGASAGDVWAITGSGNIQLNTTSAINAPTEVGLEIITL